MQAYNKIGKNIVRVRKVVHAQPTNPAIKANALLCITNGTYHMQQNAQKYVHIIKHKKCIDIIHVITLKLTSSIITENIYLISLLQSGTTTALSYFCPLYVSYFSIQYVDIPDKYVDMHDSYATQLC